MNFTPDELDWLHGAMEELERSAIESGWTDKTIMEITDLKDKLLRLRREYPARDTA